MNHLKQLEASRRLKVGDLFRIAEKLPPTGEAWTVDSMRLLSGKSYTIVEIGEVRYKDFGLIPCFELANYGFHWNFYHLHIDEQVYLLSTPSLPNI